MRILISIAFLLTLFSCGTSKKEEKKSIAKIETLSKESTVWYLITPTDSGEVSLDLCDDGDHFFLIEELKEGGTQIRYVAGSYYSEFPITNVTGSDTQLKLELTDSKGQAFNVELTITNLGELTFHDINEFTRDNLMFDPRQYPTMRGVKYVSLNQIDNYKKAKGCEE